MTATFDFLIRGGTVLDGTGAPARRADVAIVGDRIAAVGDLAAAEARQVVDAAGLTVAPGFIDAHSHSDTYLLIEPDAPSKLSQGVTTEVVGQCGGSAAPVLGTARLPSDWTALVYPALHGTRNAERGMRSEGHGVRSAECGMRSEDAASSGNNSAPSSIPHSALRIPHSDLRTPHSAFRVPHSALPGPTWSTVAEYRALFDQVRPAVNAVLLIGHNTLRGGVVGYDARAATADEVALMCRRLEQALDEGGSGLSTGLIYTPGRFSTPGEVLALARVAARHGGLYATHMRSEGDRLLEALDEALGIGRDAAIRVQISHLKTSGEENWGKLDAALARLETARREGVAVHADRYPYLAGGTDLDILLPEWAVGGGRDAILARVTDAATRVRLAAELDAARTRGAWEGVMIGGTCHPDLRHFRGRTVAQVAAELGVSPGAAVVEILYRDELRTSAFFFGMCEANMRRIYAQPWVMVGSDASLRAPWGPLAADHPHPRAYGAFPRFLRLVQDEKLMTMAEAVRRCTSLPADVFGLKGRGRLVPGAFADVALFDAAAVRDRSTYAQPHAFAEGVRQVWINGRLGFDRSRFTGDRAGRLLQSVFA